MTAKALFTIWSVAGKADLEPARPDTPPIAISLHLAAEASGSPAEMTWHDNTVLLRKQLAETPKDPRRQILLATSIHSKYITSGVEVFSTGDPREVDLMEMRALVSEALPKLPPDSLHRLTAAKLLWFCDSARRDEAFQAAKETYACTATFGAASALLGQFYMWRGEIDEALGHFQVALDYADHGSQFHLYVLVLACQAKAALAGNSMDDLPVAELYLRGPQNLALFSLLYEPPLEIDATPALEMVLASLSPDRAQALLRFVHFGSARLFVNETLQRRIMDRPFALIAAHHGQAAIPSEVAALMSTTAS